jgi:general secretion pathway protein E/type IV pilus assembly protein PilB
MEAGEILVRRGLIDPDQLEKSRQGVGEGTNVVNVAIDLGYVDEEVALRAMAEEVGLDFIDLTQTDVDLTLLETFPTKLIYRQNLFPVARSNGQLEVATSDPFNLYPIDEASAATGLSIVPLLASRSEIDKLIKRHLGVGGETVDNLIEQQSDHDVELLNDIETDGSELSEMAQEASVIRLVNEILMEALELRASDVHIESQADGLAIRYRIDGILHSQPVPPEINQFQAAIISRLKIMSRLNIAEKRLPQDGRMKLKISGRQVDVRVSIIPMIHGEGLAMRLLDKTAMVFNLQGLGMDPGLYEQFHELIKLPHGILLVTGPTGSGKTSTLYSSLLEIRDSTTKIITTEDPVEYQLEGINQIQVHSKIGFTFAHSLRSILRHDPDIVLVGEIRDQETAENAIQASLTGHLVFSTLHTNDAPSAFTRITDMGVEPFLVASTVAGVMSQRLVRVLCEHCKQPYTPDREDMPEDFPWDQLADRPLYAATGCRECRQVGYKGRLGIFELMTTNDDIRTLANSRASSWEMRKVAIESGMHTLRMDAWRKALAGQTSLDEVLRSTSSH